MRVSVLLFRCVEFPVRVRVRFRARVRMEKITSGKKTLVERKHCYILIMWHKDEPMDIEIAKVCFSLIH